MYDDDLFGFLNSYSGTTTETEQQTTQTETPSYNPQPTYSNPYSLGQDDDDYSIRPNYEEQQSYNSINQKYGVTDNEEQSAPQTFVVRQMETPIIRKEAPAVNLIKSRSKVELQARMKIAITMFSVIVATLLFAIVWNFVSASKMKSTFADKEYQIAALQADINALKGDYISFSEESDAAAKNLEGFEEVSDENTIYVDFEEVYKAAEKEHTTNWFNDVCDFLSELFA